LDTLAKIRMLYWREGNINLSRAIAYGITTGLLAYETLEYIYIMGTY